MKHRKPFMEGPESRMSTLKITLYTKKCRANPSEIDFGNQIILLPSKADALTSFLLNFHHREGDCRLNEIQFPC